MKELLLYNLDTLYLKIFIKLKDSALTLLPSIILAGSLFSFLFGMDFTGVLKRSFIAVGAILAFNFLFTNSANLGFLISDQVISKTNHILKDWSESTSIRKEGFTYNSLAPLHSPSESGDFSDDILGHLVWLLSNFALWFVKISFTIAYYLPLISIPLVALINIFPFTPKAIDGAIFSMLWIGITPVIIAILLEILNGVLVNDQIIKQASFISRALMSILFALYLVSSFAISSKMMGQTGITDAIASVGQSYSIGMVSGLTTSAINKVKKASSWFVLGKSGRDSPLKKITLNPINDGREVLNKKASEIADSNKLSAQEIFDGVMPTYDKGEKRILMANKILNPLKARRDEKDRMLAAKDFIALGKGDDSISREEMNIARLARGKNEIDKNGKEIKPKKDSKNSEKGTYVFDEKYWNDAGRDYQNGIRFKYGIPWGELPHKGFKYYPKDGRKGFPDGYQEKFAAIHPNANQNIIDHYKYFKPNKEKQSEITEKEKPKLPKIDREDKITARKLGSRDSSKIVFSIKDEEILDPDLKIKFPRIDP